MTGDPNDVIALLFQVREAGVKLGGDLDQAAGQILRVQAMSPAPVLPRLIGLSDAELAASVERLAFAISVEGSAGAGMAAALRVRDALAVEISVELLAHGDSLLDQLRPKFDAAAAVMHRATELGIHAGTTDRDILRSDDVTAARDAWAAIPAAARTLGSIAACRILFSKSTGAPPVPPRHFGSSPGARATSVEEIAGAMFRTDGREYRQDFEESWQKWLRLCTGSPARLLTLEECTRAQDAA